MTACSRCRKGEPVVELKYSGEFLCRKCFNRLFESRVRKTIRVNRLLKYDDHVGVAVSGGKDSLTILSILHGLSKKAPKSRLTAITIDEGVRGYRSKTLKSAKELCNKLGVEHHIYSFREEFDLTLDEMIRKARLRGDETPACSFCGVLRRRLLNDNARALGVSKLATGHNLDDEIQASLMNYIRGDLERIERMGAEVGVIKSSKFVPRIKPLRECPEREVALYAILNGINVDFQECPYSREAFRVTVRDMINHLEEKHSGSKYQLLRTTDKLVGILREYYTGSKKEINECSRCGELTSGEVCKTCQIIGRLRA